MLIKTESKSVPMVYHYDNVVMVRVILGNNIHAIDNY